MPRGAIPPARRVAYLRDAPAEDTTDLALRIMALRALGGDVSGAPSAVGATAPPGRPDRAARQLDGLGRPRAARAAGPRAVRYLLRAQRRSGGWSWMPSGAPDSNDTAAVIQALRRSGVRGRPIRRGLDYIRRLTAPNGGVRLDPRPRARTPSRRRGRSRRTSPPGRGRRAPPSGSSPRSAVPTGATATAALRGHAGARHRAGAAGARPEAVSAALTQPGSGRQSRPSSTSSSIRPGCQYHCQLNHRGSSRS